MTAAETAPAEVAEAAAVVTAAAAAALGRPALLAEGPEPLPIGFGARAFTCRLRGVDAPLWSGPLVVRVAADEDEARTEAAWHAWAENEGFPSPRLLSSWLAGPYGTVLSRPGLDPSVDRMAADPTTIPTIIGSLGRLHARLHAQPAAGAPGPVTDRTTALARLDARLDAAGRAAGGAAGPAGADEALRRQRAWLGATDPGPVVAVPCHGGFTPVTMHVDRRDPGSAVVTGWAGATLADREYDVANSELALWAAPYLSPDKGQRTMLKMARTYVVGGYRAGYEATGASLDGRRLAWWGAYHACAWSATLAAEMARAESCVPGPGPGDGWRPAELARVRRSFRKDLGRRFRALSDEVEAGAVAGH